MSRIGLLGGSFNPAHGGHRAVSLFARRALALDEVWWLVSPGNPLKSEKGMAPLAARMASAIAMARRAPIKPTGIERELGTRYTVDTLRAIAARYPADDFIWLMGADNLAQFDQWKDWRDIAHIMPIAVIARPGYDDDAMASPAMAWLDRFVHEPATAKDWTDWRPPALVLLRFRPDPRSATLLRQSDPHWHRRYAGRALRDPVTHAVINPEEPS